MNTPTLNKNDVIVMKKKHPCGSLEFRIARIGSDIRIICLGCKRDITLERESLEKMIKKVIPAEGEEAN